MTFVTQAEYSYTADSTLPYTMPEFDFHAGNTGPSRGIMTGNGSVSTGHNGHLMSHTATVTRGTYSTATSSSNELLEELHSFEGARIKRLHPAATRISSSSSSSVNSTHYNVNNNHNNNNHLASGTLPSQYGSSNGHHQQALSTRSSTQSATSAGCNENKYGKLMQQPNQPSKQYGPYYEQQQQPHNGNNNNLLYSSNGKATNGEGASSRNASPLSARGPSVCTSPVLRSAAPSVKSNRVINGNNNNNNNSIHLDASASGAGKTIGTGSSLTASFTSKFHKLTGNRSSTGSNALDGAITNASNSKLNHVNNNNSTTAPNGPGSSANTPPYHHHHQHQPHAHHQYQINNVTTHLHPPAQPLPSGKQPLSSSSSSSSPPPGSQAGAPGTTPSPSVHHLHHPSTHGHHHHHPHGPMGHTLSSPESAYSTGYSTDGTSPVNDTSEFRTN
uniref:Uncharacterized protein n=1 Tax=Anopheles maculatus TaxID=74869 RepID=A0A182T7P8_9DIPT